MNGSPSKPTNDIHENLGELRANLVEIRATLRAMVWTSGIILAFVVALPWRTFQ